MNFSLGEILLTISMALAIIMLSFVGPALGMGGSNVNQSDIPEYNITESNYNFIKKPPQQPELGPDRGVLNHSSDPFDDFEGQIQYELEPGENGNRTVISVVPEEQVNLIDLGVTQGSGHIDNYTFSSNDTTEKLTGNGFEIDVHSVDYKAGIYEYEIIDSPSQGSQLDWLIQVLEGFLNWVAGIWYTFYNFLIDDTANFGNLIYQNIIYIIDLFTWLITTYNGLITGAPSAWVGVFLVIPELYLSYQFLKVIVTLLDLVPFIG